jgi:hypothetical protein
LDCAEGEGAYDDTIDACDEPPMDILLPAIEEFDEYAERFERL